MRNIGKTAFSGHLAGAIGVGQKSSVVPTNRSNWIVNVRLREGNSDDGHTLVKAIAGVQQTTSVDMTDAFVDKGYRGHDYKGEATIHLAGRSSRSLTRAMKRRRNRRSAVEPKIGCLKIDLRNQ